MRRHQARTTIAARCAGTETSLLEQSLLGLAALAVVAMLSLPAARNTGVAFGWVPFWLLALPLTAWVTLRWSRRHAATVTDLRVGPHSYMFGQVDRKRSAER
ncbi:MAG: hypothetical protein E6Q88_03155 [Lysobacteraceae bacterium]|nr:MAG: hypothetical protein E6Q88_03155 [Xanthomonadaceae bacterium]